MKTHVLGAHLPGPARAPASAKGDAGRTSGGGAQARQGDQAAGQHAVHHSSQGDIKQVVPLVSQRQLGGRRRWGLVVPEGVFWQRHGCLVRSHPLRVLLRKAVACWCSWCWLQLLNLVMLLLLLLNWVLLFCVLVLQLIVLLCLYFCLWATAHRQPRSSATALLSLLRLRWERRGRGG